MSTDDHANQARQKQDLSVARTLVTELLPGLRAEEVRALAGRMGKVMQHMWKKSGRGTL